MLTSQWQLNYYLKKSTVCCLRILENHFYVYIRNKVSLFLYNILNFKKYFYWLSACIAMSWFSQMNLETHRSGEKDSQKKQAKL